MPANEEIDPSGRTMVLLGAGASADAGLLLTSALASAVVARANRNEPYRGRENPDWVRAINAVYAGMVGYLGARGQDPLSAVNIETLISAIRLLRARETHEVAPFVASWSPALSTFGAGNLPRRSGEKIAKAVVEAMSSRANFADRDITEAVADIARAAVRPNLQAPFAEAENFILVSLVDLLGAHEDVSYFEPILQLARTQHGGLDVVTLNYDLTVESAARDGRVALNRGIEAWQPGEALDFPPADGVLNLMKLHGSLDWRTSTPANSWELQLTPRRIEIVVPSDISEDERRSHVPWIVVGDREKLATDGPTLPLNFAARTALRRNMHLSVIGYSFGDAHINAMIRDWLAGDSRRTITVLDKSWTRDYAQRTADDFRSAMVRGYARLQDMRGNRLVPRALLIEGTARERLVDALLQHPVSAPDPLVAVSVVEEGELLRFDIEWFGPDLSDALVSAELRESDRPLRGIIPTLPLYSTPAEALSPRGASAVRGPRIPKWMRGESVALYAPPGSLLPVDLLLQGTTINGEMYWRGPLSKGTHVEGE